MTERPPPHDTLAGPNPDIRDVSLEVLSDRWYTLRRVTFERRHADGTWHTEHREAYDRGNGVVALLHDPDRDTVLLVRQYRVPAHLNGHPDGLILEAPAGLVDGDEDAETAIRRELEEEVGHRVVDLRRLWCLYMSPGAVTEHLTFFLGSYSEATRIGRGGGMAAEGEDIDIVEVTITEAQAMVDDGRIADAKTVLLLQHLLLDRR
jgi:nudix-type nucleoside diphosphatase (YffH/AdpP family)